MLLITKQPQGTEQKGLPQKGSINNRYRCIKAQAVSEFAIIGAIITVAFAAVLSYGQMMNSQQSLQMRTFRRALRESRNDNKVVSYTIVRDNPAFVLNPFSRLDTRRQSASSTVCAIKNDPLFPDPDDKDDRSSKEIYEINGQVHTIEPIKIKVRYDDGNDYETWMSAPIQDVAYRTQKQRTGTLNKTETASSISTTRSSSATAQGTTTLYLEDRGEFERGYLEDLKDGVDQEPWEKRMKMERLSYDFVSFAEFGLSLLLNKIIGFSPSICVTASGCLPTCYIGCVGGTAIGAAIKGAATSLLSSVFGYLISEDGPSGGAVNVGIVEGYRVSDVKSGTGSYSIPSSTFNVSH